MEKAKEYTSEEQQWLTENRLSRFQNRITPSWIRDMGENEIFVFGSNVNGYHGGGAARFAMNNFGAVWKRRRITRFFIRHSDDGRT